MERSQAKRPTQPTVSELVMDSLSASLDAHAEHTPKACGFLIGIPTDGGKSSLPISALRCVNLADGGGLLPVPQWEKDAAEITFLVGGRRVGETDTSESRRQGRGDPRGVSPGAGGGAAARGGEGIVVGRIISEYIGRGSRRWRHGDRFFGTARVFLSSKFANLGSSWPRRRQVASIRLRVIALAGCRTKNS